MTPRRRLGLRPLALACAFLAACHGREQGRSAATSSRFALFTNGGFESDAIGASPSSWTVQTYLNNRVTPLAAGGPFYTGLLAVPPKSIADLNLSQGEGALDTVVVGGAASESQVDADLGSGASLRYPKFGLRNAVVNAGSTGMNQNANSMAQTMTVGASDVDPADGQVHIRFAAAPVLQNPSHNDWEQPYFFTQLTNLRTGAVLYTRFIAAGQPGIPWKSVDTAQYTDWQLIDIAPGSQVSMGDQVQLIVFASGCSHGGHWGRVYVDAFGSSIPGLFASGAGPKSALNDTDITYTLAYKNGGALAKAGAQVSFATPPSTTFRSVSLAGCTAPAVGAAGTIRCNIGSVAAGASGSFTVTVHIAAGTTGLVSARNYWIQATDASPLLGPGIDTLVTGPPASIAVVSGSPQTAAVGKAFGAPLLAVVRDAGGNPVPNVNVSAAAPSSGPSAALSSGSGATDLSGQVSFLATANAVAGGPYTVTATASGAPVPASFSLTNAPGSPAAVAAASGGDQSATVGTAFGQPLVVVVNDAHGNPVSGVTITWTAPATGASASLPASATTNASGRASATATANGTPGSYAVTASAAGASSASFALTNTAGGPASIAVVSGSGQSTAVLTPFPQPLVVEVRDGRGNPVSGATVSYAAPASGASAALSATATTDASGRASAIATANGIAGGPYAVTARVTGAAWPASFSLTNAPRAPEPIRAADGDNQEAVVTQAFARDLVATVVDAGGNPVAGAAVVFSAPSSGASAALSARVKVTDAAGKVAVSAAANTAAGAYQVKASLADPAAAPATFSLANLPGAASALRAVSGAAQAAAVNTAFFAPLEVAALDLYGNPVPGARVSWAVPSSGASAIPSATDTTTDAGGRSSITATANGAAGVYVVTARLPSGQQADFALSNTAGPEVALTAESGGPQSAEVGTPFGAPLVVRVTSGGVPVANAAVSFHAPSGGASATLSAFAATTDSTGHAQVSAIAGTAAGAYSVTAAAAGARQPASFALTNAPGTAATIAASPASTPQRAKVGTRFAAPLSAVVKDRFGNPVPGVSVAFAAPASQPTAALEPSSLVTTDASGQAAVQVTAGPAAGQYAVTATATGVPGDASFALGNLAGAPSSISVLSGSPQAAEVTAAFASALTVLVADRAGNPVPGAAVTFSAPGSGATAALSAPTAATDAQGRAQVQATAGAVAGRYEVIASSAQGAAPALFALTNLPGAPAAIAALATSTPQSARVETPYAQALGARVLDAHGNPVPGATVAFAAPASEPSARLTASSPATDGAGMASAVAIASEVAGSFTVRAAASGVAEPATFALTNLSGAPATVSVVSGGGQSTLATTAFSAPLVVLVSDAFGNPAPGASLALALPSSGPSARAAPAAPITGADGRAAIELTANGQPGTFEAAIAAPGAATPGATSFTIAAIPTTTALSIAPESPTAGGRLTLTATVASDHGTPTGEVRFLADGRELGAAALSSGVSSLTVASPPEGPHPLTVIYDAQGAFGASSASQAVSVGKDAGYVTGGGGCSSGGEWEPAFALFGLLGLAMAARRRSRRAALLLALGGAALLQPGRATAQSSPGAALDLFHPAPAGSEWLALDSLDLRGRLRPAARLLFEYAHDPLVLYNADGSRRSVPVRHQTWLDLGASLTFLDRFRVSLELPVAVYQRGDSSTFQGLRIDPLSKGGVGDLWVAGDVRILGAYGDALTLAGGVAVLLPTGSRVNLLGNGKAGVEPRLLAAGYSGVFAWAARLGFAVQSGEIADVHFNDEIRFAASAGLRLASGRLLVGPELHGAADVGTSGGQARTAALEVDLGGHYAFAADWRVGFSVGTGLARSAGVPNLRVLTSVGWAPAFAAPRAPPPAPPPADRDGDGMSDARDLCPDVPIGEHPDPDRPGCPDGDSDHDGVLDHDDACPAVPAGQHPSAVKRGCPDADGDEDGVFDADDACPEVPAGQNPDPAKRGCPNTDRDEDGVFDSADACPEVAAGSRPDPKKPGCPLPDRDGDGVPDEIDACPDEPGAPMPDPKRNGCPGLVKVQNEQIVILQQVHFAKDQDVILGSSEPVLAAVANALKAMPEIKRVSIEGHTDSQGTPPWNLDLSQRRANSVKAWLVRRGIAESRLESHGFGQARPIAGNETPEGRAANRRVEFRIVRREAAGG